MDVSIIVSNRNGREFLRDCLLSLTGAGRPTCSHEILVADNGSSDGSLEMLRSHFPQVVPVAHGQDLGFTRSNNRAIAKSSGRYVHLLNNDTIVLPGAIDRLVAFLDATPEAAGVGNRLLYPDGREQYSGRRFPAALNVLFGRLSLLTRWFPNNRWSRAYLYADELERGVPFEVDWLSHAGVLYRRVALDAVGGLDETMYYWHEAMVALDLRERGQKLFLHPSARILHYEGHGSGRRGFRARVLHHVDFARGSYRFRCRHEKLGRVDPRRLLVAAGLALRAGLLILTEGLRPAKPVPDMEPQVEGDYARLVATLLSAPPGELCTLLFTAVSAGEGVSSVVATLGQELALHGRAETLLIDANFADPKLHEHLLADPGEGFTELVAGDPAAAERGVRRVGSSLSLLPHGHARVLIAHPAGQDALVRALETLRLGRRFLLIDAPPVMGRADTLAMAARCDAVILVVRAEQSACDAVERAWKELRQAGARVLGAVYNAKPFYIPEAVYRRL